MDGPNSKFWKVAAAVHPRFRLLWVDDEEEKEDIRRLVKAELRKLNEPTDAQVIHVDNENPPTGNDGSGSPLGSDENRPTAAKKAKVFFSLLSRKRVQGSVQRVVPFVDHEVNQFLDGDATEGKIDHTTLGPLLELYLKMNTPLPSSAPVERLFSLAGRIFVPLRANLKDETFSQLLFLRANQHLYNMHSGKPTPLGSGCD
jgi:hypothetical protein